ncbi:IQ domain-containing protein G [Eufriesea mexicana]|uniref:Dynein regulatory complex protein 9 n=1 Tax=Eufriesea mexicana TaxID=516756 RepID=A0A310SR98_9HYME|nr:PREDICTED: IQ domain-containing protein G [Eufriesea mexicana]OAD62186.1 IQ domain-containing protein G [Eufriesea mexicana]
MATLAANGSSRFSPAERPAILAALEEFTNALAIYHSTLRKPTEHDNDILVDCLPLDTDHLKAFAEKIMKIQDANERATDKKAYQNSLYMMRIMEDLKEEIREQGTFEVLSKEIEKIVTREKEVEALLKEEKEVRRTAAELRKIIAERKVANEQEKRRILNELSEEQCSMEKLKLIANTVLEYVMEWEKAKCEQNSLRCDMEIEKLKEILNNWRVREKNKDRVHAELTKFLIQDTASLERKTKEWEERYDREKETYEKEIRQLRIETETRRKQLDELKEEHRRNQEFIDTYLAEKEALKKEKELQECIRKSAIKIQAWWRGVMVRRKLGPYRPMEKKKKRQVKTKK